MKIFYRFFIILILGSGSLFAQPTVFKKTTDREWREEEKFVRTHHPEHFYLYSFDLNNLLEIVKDVPALSNEASPITLNIPDANGAFQTYWIYDNPAMEPELAKDVPNIRSLKAVSVENPSNNLSISLSDIFGMHAMGTKTDGTVYYIDNYTNDLNTIIVYDRTSLELPKNRFNCLTAGNSFDANEHTTTSIPVQSLSTDDKKRTYRLALACTTEYAEFHVNNAPPNVPKFTIKQQKNIVLAAMNVTITRINQIFERELNVHLNLVANNKEIIFITSDNFSNNNANMLIMQSQSVINSVIGSANYDIGHTFSTGAGGLASLASVCSANFKAQGITGASSPVGDAYDVDYVAHEMGHQFGANHTFNNACQWNRNNSTAMETGSGSTIMSYAGICSPDVQSQVNDYYHYISIKEMQNFLLTTTCAQQTTIANSAPAVPALQSKTIPYGTPFILSTTAIDADGDEMTYAFEQTDTQISSQPPAASSTEGPNFRSVAPTKNNYRSFPNETTVLGGTTNANGIVSNTWERLATTARTYHFVAIVRDNNPLGGRVVYTPEVTINVANTGPFVITYPDNNPSTTEPVWHTGSSKTITWNVAGTTSNNINVSHVNILISTDNGKSYTTLIANTPNDGNETITLPASLENTYNGRIKIEAVNNIFYTVSKPLTIWDPAMSNESFEKQTLKIFPNPAKDVLNISFSSEKNGRTQYSIFDLNGRLVKTFEKEHFEQSHHQITIDFLASGTYVLIVNHNGKSSSHKFIKQ